MSTLLDRPKMYSLNRSPGFKLRNPMNPRGDGLLPKFGDLDRVMLPVGGRGVSSMAPLLVCRMSRPHGRVRGSTAGERGE